MDRPIEKERSMTVNEIISELRGLSEEDLRDINRVAIERIKALRSYNSASKRRLFSPGDQVAFRGRYGRRQGEIVRLKRIKAIVKCDGQNWDVPISMLERAA